MLDKQAIKEFLEEYLEDIEIPKNINLDDLADVFIEYCENDYYEWLKDNANSFFEGYDGIDWGAIEKRIKDTQKKAT